MPSSVTTATSPTASAGPPPCAPCASSAPAGSPAAARTCCGAERLREAGPRLRGKRIVVDPGHGGPDRPGHRRGHRGRPHVGPRPPDRGTHGRGRQEPLLTRREDTARRRPSAPRSPTRPGPTSCCPCTSMRTAAARRGSRELLLRQRLGPPPRSARHSPGWSAANSSPAPHARPRHAGPHLGPAADHPDARGPRGLRLSDQPGRPATAARPRVPGRRGRGRARRGQAAVPAGRRRPADRHVHLFRTYWPASWSIRGHTACTVSTPRH